MIEATSPVPARSRTVKPQLTDPLFRVGVVPFIPWCEIQDALPVADGWHYFIRNSYNPWASGWMTEDDVVAEVTKAKKGVL